MDVELDIISLILLALIVIFLVIPLLFPSDPDTFPFILNNQSLPAKVRYPKESAIYRHRDQPHGYPLISGLSLRKGYEAPRDGDLRDVWEIALQKNATVGVVRGGRCDYEKLSSRQEDLIKLGNGLRELAGENGKVVIYLPNTVENLLTIFGTYSRRTHGLILACAFHSLTSIILPFATPTHSQPTIPDDIVDILKKAQPQVLVLPAGLALQDLKQISSLKRIVVVDISTAPHLDWSSEGEDVPVQTWTEVLDSPAHHEPPEPPSIAIQSFMRTAGEIKSIEFSHKVRFHALHLIIECCCGNCKSNKTPSQKSCPIRKRCCPPSCSLLRHNFPYSYLCRISVGYALEILALTLRMYNTTSFSHRRSCSGKPFAPTPPHNCCSDLSSNQPSFTNNYGLPP
jgi:hypothetical protein